MPKQRCLPKVSDVDAWIASCGYTLKWCSLTTDLDLRQWGVWMAFYVWIFLDLVPIAMTRRLAIFDDDILVCNDLIWMQIFNEFNSRKIHDEINVFSGVQKNSLFLVIIVGTLVGQVHFFVDFLSTAHANALFLVFQTPWSNTFAPKKYFRHTCSANFPTIIVLSKAVVKFCFCSETKKCSQFPNLEIVYQKIFRR